MHLCSLALVYWRHNRQNLLLLLNKDSLRSRGEMDVILSISFKITAEIEIRKHKLMFCVLFRGGVVSTLFRICSVIAMKCVYIVFYCQ